jgi:hypothetical protein
MDAMGEADELGYDDELPPGREPFLTPETRAIAGAGVVLMSVFSTSVFQYMAFLLYRNDDGSSAPATQYLLLAGPTAVMAAVGAGLGWSTRNQPMSPGLRGVAGAAVLVGAGLALLVIATSVAGYVWGDDPTQQF